LRNPTETSWGVSRPAELDAKPPSPLAPPSQLQRRARMEQLLRRRKHGRRWGCEKSGFLMKTMGLSWGFEDFHGIFMGYHGIYNLLGGYNLGVISG